MSKWRRQRSGLHYVEMGKEEDEQKKDEGGGERREEKEKRKIRGKKKE